MHLTCLAGSMQLSYFVEWRPLLWTPAVKWLIGAPTRFAGKTVLDLGCRSGRMSCFFGLLGANVTGVEMNGVSLDRAWNEVDHWNLRNRVQFVSYDGDPAQIPGHDYDFIFVKSVLVIVPEIDQFLIALSRKLALEGELLAAENVRGGSALRFMRYFVLHHQWKNVEDRFHGVDAAFLASVNEPFDIIGFRKYYGLVAAIRAKKKREVQGAINVG